MFMLRSTGVRTGWVYVAGCSVLLCLLFFRRRGGRLLSRASKWVVGEFIDYKVRHVHSTTNVERICFHFFYLSFFVLFPLRTRSMRPRATVWVTMRATSLSAQMTRLTPTPPSDGESHNGLEQRWHNGRGLYCC